MLITNCSVSCSSEQLLDSPRIAHPPCQGPGMTSRLLDSVCDSRCSRSQTGLRRERVQGHKPHADRQTDGQKAVCRFPLRAGPQRRHGRVRWPQGLPSGCHPLSDVCGALRFVTLGRPALGGSQREAGGRRLRGAESRDGAARRVTGRRRWKPHFPAGHPELRLLRPRGSKGPGASGHPLSGPSAHLEREQAGRVGSGAGGCPHGSAQARLPAAE